MKKLFKILAMFLFANALAFCSTNPNSKEKIMKETKIKMSFDKEEIIVKLFDNKTSKDLLEQLPLTLEFEDFAGAEKIAYPNKKLTVDKSSSAGETSDFCYYAPWGNLAVFYRGYGNDSGLVKLGRIESGKETLRKIKEGTKVKIEIIR